jgi:hypothetical protein
MTTLKVFGSALAALATLTVGLGRLNWPEGFWTGRTALLAGALVFIFAWTVFDTAEKSWAARRAKKEARINTARQDGEQVLKGTLVQVQRLTGLNWTEIGLHLFLVEKKWSVGEYQRHIVRVKMSEYPPTTGIVWTKGKGVIGRCWDNKTFEAHDVRLAYAPYMGFTATEWANLSKDERFGLSFDEFTRTKEFFGAILAAPILEDMGSLYVGCVSLDAPGDSFAKLNTVQVKELLQLAATTIGALVRKGTGG